MDYSLVVFMMHKEEGGGSPQTEVDIQRRLIVHVTIHVIAPTLSTAEENTLKRWITRLTITGFPATPMLIKEMADEIRTRRVQVASSQNPTSTNTLSIGHEWIYRLQKRHPDLKECYSRQLESDRAKEANLEKIQAWFNAFQTRFNERKYELDDIYNMDETGFAIGGTQTTRILLTLPRNQIGRLQLESRSG
jgi:hypothetical protein